MKIYTIGDIHPETGVVLFAKRKKDEQGLISIVLTTDIDEATFYDWKASVQSEFDLLAGLYMASGVRVLTLEFVKETPNVPS